MTDQATTVARDERPVAHVLPFYFPRIGGVENVARELARVQASSRTVTVVTTNSHAEDSPRSDRDGIVLVHRHCGKEIAHTPVSPGFLAHLAMLPRETLVHVHLAQALVPEALLWRSLVLRRSYLVHFHMEVDASGPLGVLLAPYKKFAFGPALRRADQVVVLTEAQRDFVKSKYGVDESKVHVVPNGVDVERFAPPHPRSRDTAQKLRLLFVGRLEAQKNVSLLVSAVALTGQSVQLTIVGDGEQREALERQVEESCPGQVVFVGRQVGIKLREHYHHADVLVLTSEREGMPLVVLEALAAHLPVVSTDIDGMAQLLGEAGLLTSFDPKEIAQTFEMLSSDESAYSALSSAAARRAQSMSWEAVAGQLNEVYARVR